LLYCFIWNIELAYFIAFLYNKKGTGFESKTVPFLVLSKDLRANCPLLIPSFKEPTAASLPEHCTKV